MKHDRLVVGLFTRMEDARHAVSLLREVGFSPSDISMVAPGEHREECLQLLHNDSPLVTEVTAIGGGIGVVAGAVVTAGLGVALFAFGPLASILIGAGAGAAVGTVVGALVGLGLAENAATIYAEALESGSSIVGIRIAADMSAVPTDLARENLLLAGAGHVNVLTCPPEESGNHAALD